MTPPHPPPVPRWKNHLNVMHCTFFVLGIYFCLNACITSQQHQHKNDKGHSLQSIALSGIGFFSVRTKIFETKWKCLRSLHVNQ